MAIENTVSSVFYPSSSVVKSVFDCHLHGVFKKQIRASSDLLLNISLAGGQSLK